MKVEVTEIENDKILMNTKFYSWEKCKLNIFKLNAS